MNLHEAIFVEGEIKELRYRGDGQFGLNINNICFLGNLNDDRLSLLNLNLNVSLITPEFRRELLKVLKKHKGKTPIKVICYDPSTGYRLPMNCKAAQVRVSEGLLEGLERLGITCEPELK